MTTALLVIDVQESFRARADDWATASAPDIGDRIDRLVAHSRAAGHEIVWILHSEPGSGSVFDPACGHVRVFDELTPADTEALLHKTSHNAFTTTRLGQLLTAAGVTPDGRRERATLTGLFTSATGTTPLRYQQDLRLELAAQLVDRGWTSEAAARQVGFSDARMLRRLRADG